MHIPRYLLLFNVVVLTAGLSVAEESTAKDLIAEVDSSLAAGDWASADRIASRIFARFDRMHLSVVPTWYPILHFKAGWCAMKLERWDDAAKHFETSYRKSDPSENPFHASSLRGWAEAAVKLGEYDVALRLYRRYAEETSTLDWENPFQQGTKGER